MNGESFRTRCPERGCPGLEWHEGISGRVVDGCGHPAKESGCPFQCERYPLLRRAVIEGRLPGHLLGDGPAFEVAQYGSTMELRPDGYWYRDGKRMNGCTSRRERWAVGIGSILGSAVAVGAIIFFL